MKRGLQCVLSICMCIDRCGQGAVPTGSDHCAHSCWQQARVAVRLAQQHVVGAIFKTHRASPIPGQVVLGKARLIHKPSQAPEHLL